MTGDTSPVERPTARVLKFRRGQGAPAAAPVPDLARFQRSPADPGSDEYRHRMLVNLAALGFVIVLICAGYWLADTLARLRKDQDCALTGRRGCAPAAILPLDGSPRTGQRN
jgi:hypothetical protein